MIVGSEPGWKEVIQGTPFVGPVGEEVDRLLELCGVPRDQWALTNYFRRPAPGKGVPHPQEDYEEAGHCLKEELLRVQPTLIVPLGREAIRFFLGDVDVDEVWGLHLRPSAETLVRLGLPSGCTIAPQVHPAAGFHSPESSNQVLVGFERLRRVLRGLTPARGLHDDPYPTPDYRELTTAAEFQDYADCVNAEQFGNPVLEVANDTEGYTHAPWSIQLSCKAGEGVLLRKPEVLEAFVAWAKEVKPRFVFHAGLHDATMNRVMGLDVFEEGLDIEDTQLMAYELGVIPQGLKPLAVRECAMPMLGYKEVLGDAQEKHARAYLTKVWHWQRERYEHLQRLDFDFQTRVMGRRIKKLPKHPMPDLLKVAQRVMGSNDPYKLWNDQVIDVHVAAHAQFGEMPEASLSDVEPAVALRYAARDPDATWRVRDALMPRIKEMGLEPVYRLDLATYPILDRMMRVGIQPDPEAFARLAVLLDREIAKLRASLAAITGWDEFNPNSGDQVATYIFDVLGCEPIGKKTEGGRFSTNDKVLEAVQRMYPEYPQIADIRSYREYFKLRWTFVERLPELVDRWPHDERIHCQLLLTRTPSGRLAAKDPNLLAMPKHGKFAKAFRACFVPKPGCLFLSSDESQVELRVLAHLSQDPVMCAIFRGERRNADGSIIDLHAAMAQRIFGVEPRDQDETAHRLPAKAINFGLPMGMQAQGLTLELRKGGLDVDESDAQRWIDEADKLYAAVPDYKARCVREAEQNGFVRCLSGRIRYVGGIRSRDKRVRAEAERFAFSTPIQEGAQWIGKGVLASCWRDIYVPERRQGHYVEPVLWIHDDLLSEVQANRVKALAPVLQRIMTTAPAGFSIPLETKPEAGLNWAEMVKL